MGAWGHAVRGAGPLVRVFLGLVSGGHVIREIDAGAGAVLGCCLECWLRCSSGSAARGAGVQSLAHFSLFGVYADVISAN